MPVVGNIAGYFVHAFTDSVTLMTVHFIQTTHDIKFELKHKQSIVMD